MHKRIRSALAALILLAPLAAAELTIEALVADAGLDEGPRAMRDHEGWDAARPIIIRDMGFDLDALRDSPVGDRIRLAASVADAMRLAPEAGAIVGFCDSALLDAAPHVSWVQIFWAGAERCLAADGIARGEIVLTNMQKMSSPVIAEHAIALTLALARGLPRFAAAMTEGAWARDERSTAGMTDIAGKTMLVLGLGGIGTEVARRADALGMRVIATRNSRREGPAFVDYVGLADETLELAAEADVIVNALPLTEQTRGLLDAAFFEVLQGAYLVNIGRGATVNTDDLVAALESGKVAGAGLDVTDPEPLPADHPLWSMDNVLISPHVAARGGGHERHRVLALENIRRYFAGESLYNVVDPDKGY